MLHSAFLCALFLVINIYLFSICSCNDEPIIGILTVPCKPPEDSWCTTWPGYIQNYTTSYITASYIKWIESGGGKVIPLFYDDKWSNIQTLLTQINGILFTGGGGSYNPNNPYFIQFNKILDYLQNFAQQNKNKNISIPVWATCLGFEGLCARYSHNWNTS